MARGLLFFAPLQTRRGVDPPANQAISMLREFKDPTGKIWRVWDVYPSPRAKAAAGADDTSQLCVPFPTRELSDGWLCFESGSEKRRLAPIPPEWEICGIPALAELCARAGYISHSGPQEVST
jgi:hypothetical protein